MKNFSDLLDIDASITVILRLRPIIANGVPDCRVQINDMVLHDHDLPGDIELSTVLPLHENISIVVSMRNKKYSAENETAVIIQDLLIDDFNVVPGWTHLAAYINDHGNNEPTSYLGFNGSWRLDINQPFYIWRHQVTGQGWLLKPQINNS